MPNSKKNPSKKSKKGTNKKKTKETKDAELSSIFASRLVSTLLDLEANDDEDSFLDDSWDDEEDIDISLLTPKEIIDILNFLGGDFTLSEGKAIKKFVTFIENVAEEEFDDIEDLEKLEEESDNYQENIIEETRKGKNINKLTKKKKTKAKKESGKSKKLGPSDNEVYIIETKFGSATRTIGLTSEQTLDDLHIAIQNFYNWDNDHLYAFYMDNKPYSNTNCYNHPMSNEPPFANKIKLKDLNLRKNKKFLYLFDFGDDNMFNLKFIEKKSTSDFDTTDFPLLISKKGRNPKQYDYY